MNNLSSFSVQELNALECSQANGGGLGGIHHGISVEDQKVIAHAIGDFFRGLWDGIVS